MKIIILGAGQVGGTLAQHLADESFDITLVDRDPKRLRELRDRLDIQTVEGMASHPDVLRRAGADDADMLVAVTNSDEVNMVACQVSYSVYRTPTKIARVRAHAYHGKDGFFSRDHMPIDVLINPEEVVTSQIEALLEFPGALQVLDFADGSLQLVGVRAESGGLLVGYRLRRIREHMPNVQARVAAIFRSGRTIKPTGDTVIEAGDEVFFIAGRGDIHRVISEFGTASRAHQRVMIAGGGNIGSRLANLIERRFKVKILDRNADRCRAMSEHMAHALVLQGDATDRELLVEENIESTDVFCALTNDDEANVMASMMARELGAKQVLALISKPAYVELAQGTLVDIAISPQQATISSMLNHLRRGDVARAHRLRRGGGAAEALEGIVHGDAATSPMIGRTPRQVQLPPGTTFGALVRGEQVYADDDVVIENDDHIVLFLTDRSRIREVERLFQVGLNFFG